VTQTDSRCPILDAEARRAQGRHRERAGAPTAAQRPARQCRAATCWPHECPHLSPGRARAQAACGWPSESSPSLLRVFPESSPRLLRAISESSPSQGPGGPAMPARKAPGGPNLRRVGSAAARDPFSQRPGPVLKCVLAAARDRSGPGPLREGTRVKAPRFDPHRSDPQRPGTRRSSLRCPRDWRTRLVRTILASSPPARSRRHRRPARCRTHCVSL
jgi:hypothetical protein